MKNLAYISEAESDILERRPAKLFETSQFRKKVLSLERCYFDREDFDYWIPRILNERKKYV